MKFSPTTSFKDFLKVCLIVIAVPLFLYALYEPIADTHQFWRHGVESKAHVIALDHTYKGRRSFTTQYYYKIKIAGRTTVTRFSMQLPIGQTVTVLTLLNDRDKIVLGNEDNNWLELYANRTSLAYIVIMSLALLAVFLKLAGMYRKRARPRYRDLSD